MELDGEFGLDRAMSRWMSIFPETAAYQSPQHHWVAALRDEVELVPAAQIGLNTMLISEGIYLSQKLGREVTPQEVTEHSVSTSLSI